ncbi:MAG: hypothetical protein WKG07_40570 [Hymenobacter sp.]
MSVALDELCGAARRGADRPATLWTRPAVHGRGCVVGRDPAPLSAGSRRSVSHRRTSGRRWEPNRRCTPPFCPATARTGVSLTPRLFPRPGHTYPTSATEPAARDDPSARVGRRTAWLERPHVERAPRRRRRDPPAVDHRRPARGRSRPPTLDDLLASAPTTISGRAVTVEAADR